MKAGTKRDQQAAMNAVEKIIGNWDDWDAEAQQCAQVDQDARIWLLIMRTKILTCLWQEFGWAMNE